jgi:hypothetical protein
VGLVMREEEEAGDNEKIVVEVEREGNLYPPLAVVLVVELEEVQILEALPPVPHPVP